MRIKPSDILNHSPELLSTLGMREMESTVIIILKHLKEHGDNIDNDFHLSIFTFDSMLGFTHLCANGWIESSYPNGRFRMREKLIERISE